MSCRPQPSHTHPLLQVQAVDFDPHSLRHVLPQAGRVIQAALQQHAGRVYVHCTAGLGRAPAACIAHRFWFSEQQLDEVSRH